MTAFKEALTQCKRAALTQSKSASKAFTNGVLSPLRAFKWVTREPLKQFMNNNGFR